MSGGIDSRFKFTEKERDGETGYDYFGARYFDARIARWLAVDPHLDSYSSLSPYDYVGNNPMAFKDLDGRDSTVYLRSSTKKATEDDLKKVAQQAKTVIDENAIPMKVEIVSTDPVLDPTDVSIEISDDTHRTIVKRKKMNPNVEGVSPIGSQQAVVTVDAFSRGITEIGLGNIVIHEAIHAMGQAEHTEGTITQSPTTRSQINEPKQSISPQDKQFILDKFLKRTK